MNVMEMKPKSCVFILEPPLGDSCKSLEMKIEKQTKGGFITQGIIMQKKSRIYY